MTTAKIYIRLSRDEVGQTSTDDQERECRKLADRLGITNIKVYLEQPGTSGYKDVPRPVFEKLMTGLSNGDVVIAWALDRLTRRGMEQAGQILRLLEECGARLVTVSDGIDTAQDFGTDINVGIRAIMAREYSKGISRNVKRGKESGAVAGNWGGGSQWFGYGLDADGSWRGPKTFDDVRGPAFVEMCKRYADHEPLPAIVQDMTIRGVTTPSGVPLRAENVLRLLLNPRYAAIRIHNGTAYDGNWPPLISPELHEAAKAARYTAERMAHWPTNPTGARTYLLSGFVVCYKCGRPMRGKLRKGGQRRYACQTKNCMGALRIAEPLEHFVTEAVLYRLDTPELGKLLERDNDGDVVRNVVAETNVTKAKLDRLIDAYQDGLITKQQFTTRKTGLEAAIQAAESRLQTIMRQRTGLTIEPGQRLRTAFEAWDLAKRRKLIGLVITNIIANPSNASTIKKRDYYLGKYKFSTADIVINWADTNLATP